MARYGITAEELHDSIVEAMRRFGNHMGFRIDDILDRHDQHPLEQIITSVMLRLSLETTKLKSSEYGPEFDKFAKRAREELVPKIEVSDVFVSITPLSKDKVDIKFAVELGLAIMYNKPILAVIQPGTQISEKLAQVVDKFVELDFSDPHGRDRILEALKQMDVDK